MLGLAVIPWLALPGFFLGVAAPLPPIAYESLILEDQLHQVARFEGLEVWVAFIKSPGQEMGLWIHILNGSDHAVEIFPQRIRAEAITDAPDGEKRQRLRTYHPVQYESRVRRRNWTTGNVRPIAPPSMAAGSFPPFNPLGTPPTLTEKECGSGNEQACGVLFRQGKSIRKPRPQNFPAREWGAPSDVALMWPRTVPSGQVYDGMVFLKYLPAKRYHVRIPLDGQELDFDGSPAP